MKANTTIFAIIQTAFTLSLWSVLPVLKVCALLTNTSDNMCANRGN
ncbi:unnamed protein product [Medioppia subpectinata]|uniref:Uncharacterized protein n=1 Tax=Medioppia subpectinata TaxID=1979941 RepID=A0A7R9QHM7_9ACAR|nr:unnamed protein product [Medioppia subpectinata]CAG2120970.1 unnamed protein product [Medioppia subpectinata]